MTSKSNAEQIVDFALIPVCSRPYACYARHRRMLLTGLADTHLKTYIAPMRQREKLIDDIETWYPFEPVNRCYRFKILVLQRLLEIVTDLDQALWLQNDSLLISVIDRFNHCLRELAPHSFDRRCCCYGHILFIIPLCE